jgi:tyrosyl-tRNA synthetase
VGKHVTVNQMTAKESVRARLESEAGISYTEFSYMLLQANDFRHLHQHHGVELQMGGSDQWGNITAGIDLIRRTSGAHVHGLTWPLLLKSDGTKFGKSAAGAIWLDPSKTTPYQFRQFWVQSEDAAVGDYLLRFSSRPVDDLAALLAEHATAPERRTAQRALADELTALVHGAAAAAAAAGAAEVLFGGDPTTVDAEVLATVAAEIPSSRQSATVLSDVVATLVATGLASSNSDARRTLESRGFRANGQVLEVGADLTALTPLHGKYLLLRRGKTAYHLVETIS